MPPICRAVLLCVLLAPSLVLAQGRDKAVSCSVHGHVANCDGVLACDRAWADHIRDEHRGGDADLYWDRVTPASFSVRGTPAYVTLRALLLGGGVGALAGGVVEGPDPETFREQAGVLIGSGTFLGLGVLKNRGGWRPLPSALAGGLAGGALGAGIGKAMEKSPRGTAARARERERAQEAAVQGAGAGVATGLFLPAVSKALGWPAFGPALPARLHLRPWRSGFSLQWFW